MLNFSKYGEQQILRWNLPKKIYDREILRKIAHQNRNRHIAICPCINYQLIWGTLDFGTKFAQKILYGGVLGQTQPGNNLF